MALLWLGYDALMVPYKLAWNIADEGVWVKLTWLSRCFWTVDLISNFFVAYRTPDAHLEKRIVKTAKNYLRGGFAFDFLIVGSNGSASQPCLPRTILKAMKCLSRGIVALRCTG
jgi:hypothetical protein